MVNMAKIWILLVLHRTIMFRGPEVRGWEASYTWRGQQRLAP
jgi:hypothetical protein